MKTFNKVTVTGQVYDFNPERLREMETKKGNAIAGTIQVDSGNGVIVDCELFAYPNFSSGKANPIYALGLDLLNKNIKTKKEDAESAPWVTLEGDIGADMYVSKRTNEVTVAQRFNARFHRDVFNKEAKNTWKVDMLVTSVKEIEEDTEKQLPRYAIVRGFIIDDYREEFREVSFRAVTEQAIDYLIGLPASLKEPYYVSAWGSIKNVGRTVVRKNAFGEDDVEVYNYPQWIMIGMSEEPYTVMEGGDMTPDQYSTMYGELLAKKETMLNAAKAVSVEVEDDDLPF